MVHKHTYHYGISSIYCANVVATKLIRIGETQHGEPTTAL